jgi:hypothetical protein
MVMNEVLRSAKEAIPDAHERKPGDVFAYVLTW